MNVIIEIHGGIIENVITCKCTAQAGLIYAAKAKEMGVTLEDEDIQAMSYDDAALERVTEEVQNQLEDTSKELKWFESHHYKAVK